MGRMRTCRITVTLGNLNPMHGGLDIKAFAKAWKEVGSLFKNRMHFGYKVTIDVSDVMEFYLRTKALTDKDVTLQKAVRRFPGYGVRMVASFKGGNSDEWQDEIVERLLENLYLAMNLAAPGSCNLYPGGFRRKKPFRSSCSIERYVRLDRCTDALHFACATAMERGWPRIQFIQLSDVWKWLEQIGALTVEVAREPVHRALFTFLRLGSTDTHNIDLIQLCVQAIESLLGGGAPARVVQRRVETILGSPKSHKGWYAELYSTRSQLVHGSAPILRPGPWLNDGDAGAQYFKQVDQAYVVLLALIQALITNRSRAFKIEETVRPC